MINLLEGSAVDIRRLLSDGKITTVDLILLYLEQTERHNHEGIMLRSKLVSSR